MKRRQFIALSGATMAWPILASAQQAAKIPRIGYLTPAIGPNAVDLAFMEALPQLGWIRDRNIRIEFRSAGGRQENIAPMVAEVAALGLDLNVVWGQAVVLPLRQAAPQTPMVFLITDIDPVDSGLVRSLANPGPNITGVTCANIEITGKRLQLLKEVVPALAHVAVLFSPEQTRNKLAIRALRAASKALLVDLDEIEAQSPTELEDVITSAKLRGAQALYIWPSGFAFSYAKEISDIAIAIRLPSLHPFQKDAYSGGLLAYAADMNQQSRHGAEYADRILRGTPAGELPVQLMSKYELVVNLRTAKILDLQIPSNLLDLADKVIE